MALRKISMLEEQVIQQLVTHQRSSATTEILVCVDDKGEREIDRAEGTPDRVDLTLAMTGHLDNGGRCRLWHNHPKYGSLSEGDWRLVLAYPGVEEISAINESGTVFRGAVVDSANLDKVVKVEEISREIPYTNGRKLKIKRCLFTDLLTVADNVLTTTDDPKRNLFLSQFAGHIVNLTLASKGIIDYEPILSEKDKVELTRSEAVQVLASAETAVENVFDEELRT